MKTIELHGREEIKVFFKDEFKRSNRSDLDQYVDDLLQYPDGTEFGLPSEYYIDGVWETRPRKAEVIIIYHT